MLNDDTNSLGDAATTNERHGRRAADRVPFCACTVREASREKSFGGAKDVGK